MDITPFILFSQNTDEQSKKYQYFKESSFLFNKIQEFVKFLFACRENYFSQIFLNIENESEAQQILSIQNISEISRSLKNKGKIVINLIKDFQIDPKFKLQALMKANCLIDITTTQNCLVFEKQLQEINNDNLITYKTELYKFDEQHSRDALGTYEYPIQVQSSELIKNEKLNPFQAVANTNTEVKKINENELLEGQESPSITAPTISIKSGPCANCTCGRNKAVQPNTEFVSKCGRCGLGDEFRCPGCPFRGQPAFNSAELKEESKTGTCEKEKKCCKNQPQGACSGSGSCGKSCETCPNKGMCKKQGKSCETCPNKMNCPFSKEVEPTVQIGDKVEVAMTDTINAPETAEDVAAKIMGTGIVKLNI